MSDADRLLVEMKRRACGRARVPIETVWEAFRASLRGYTGSSEARADLAQALAGLDERGTIALPRMRERWDASAQPPLPAWVRITQARERRHTIDHRAIAWPPELAFVARMRRVDLVDELLAVQQFLASGGRERVIVPTGERSLELFGDEKRLSALRKTSLFAPGHLTLSLLRCYDVAPPLVWELGPKAAAGRHVLVIENLDTYASFCRWNREAGSFAAIAYGHGSELVATIRDLPRLCEAVGGAVAEYFGDLDRRGLEIPHRARSVLGAQAPGITLRPAERWYAELLRHADRASPADERVDPDDPVLGWLPTRLRTPAAAVLASGRRLPQEHVGFEVLARLPGRTSDRP